MSESNSNQYEFESVSNENVKRILALLRAGDEMINLDEYREAILIIGRTGSGKSTLTHFLTGNNEDLISVEQGQDTSEFLISDASNKISNTTTISKTIFPELVVDHETKTAYIDCPGFGDRGRNEAYDIAIAYFIKKVMANVKKVKIVLTASHPSLQKGVSRNDFPYLLERVTTLIKNIEKYVDGVALIATKVHNDYPPRKIRGKIEYVLVPDKLVIENIANFLHEVKASLNETQNSTELYQSDIRNVENRLFFENSRKLLDALLQKKGTEYTRLGIFRRPDGAGRLSEIELLQDGKAILKSMLKNNLKYVPVNIDDIGYAVSDKAKNIITDLVGEINRNIANDVSEINDVSINFYKQLERDMLDDDMYMLRDHLEAGANALAEISSIGETAKANELVSRVTENLAEPCKRASQVFLNDITNLGKFLNFLRDVSDAQFDSFAWKWVAELKTVVAYVENSLKWYNFLVALRERLSDYDVQKDTKRFNAPKFVSGSDLLDNFANFSKFFNEISDSIIINTQYLKELKKVKIDDTKLQYFDKVIQNTLHDSLTFTTDEYGRSLQVTGEYVKISHVIQHTSYKKSQSVRIFAKHTVFIDANMTKENDISIVAPRWDIIGSRMINLDGASAENWSPDTAPDGSCAGCAGQNGAPGKPGGSAGHFFGLGKEFKNVQQLQIHAKGGKGGMGQIGGNGAAGIQGTSYSSEVSSKQIICYKDQECKVNLDNHGNWCDLYSELYGSHGGRGGDAGRGGGPGLGGYAGSVTVIGAIDGEKPEILIKVEKGDDGSFGLHGRCGKGGEGGLNRSAKVCTNCGRTEWDWVKDDGRAPDGEKGTCLYISSLENSNIQGRAQPTEKDFLYPPSSVLSAFRNELINDFDNCIRKSHSLQFYEVLLKDHILKYDNANQILSEFKHLEKYYCKLPRRINETFYSHFSERIVKLLNNSSKSNDRKLLNFLQLAVTSKLIRLKKKPDSRLVFDQRTYFDVLKTNDMEKIRHFFDDRANEEIEQTKKLIGIITSDIYDVNRRVTYDIIRYSSNDEVENLDNQLLKLKLFSKLKIFDEFFDFVVSLAKANLALVNKMNIAGVHPSVEISISGVDGRIIERNLGVIERLIEKEIEAVEHAVLNEIKNLQSLGDEFDQIVDYLQDTVINLHSHRFIIDRSFLYSIFPGVQEVMDKISGINSRLLKNYGTTVQAIVRRFENLVKLIQYDASLYNTDVGIIQEFQLHSLTSSIDNIREKDACLENTTREIFDLMVPVLRFAKSSLASDSVMYKPENLEKFRAIISQSLGEIKLKIYKLIAQFEIDEDLQSIRENVEEALNQLIVIFDVTLPEQHDRTLMKCAYLYLKNEDELGKNEAQHYLSNVIYGDIHFYEYERSIDAFKMFIHPFDVLTTDNITLPSISNIDSKYQDTIASNVALLESKLQSWEPTIIANEFNSRNKNGAFFVWSSEKHFESISKLLRGRAVALKAEDINFTRQFLKFDNIKLSFKLYNRTMQQLLDEDLKSFNISMTHSGSSYFSLCNHVELVHQDATRFIYDVNRTTTEVDSISNTLKPVLSPFTTWIFELHPVNENVNFDILQPYRKSAIDIELEGNATYVDSLNNTACQQIAFRISDTYQLPVSSAENGKNIASNSSDAYLPDLAIDTNRTTAPKELIRKRRDVDSSKGIFNTNFLKSLNPFNYFIDTKPESHFEPSSDPQLTEWSYEPNQETNFSPQSFNVNASLTLVDFVIRNVTKAKPYKSVEKSMSADQARVIAVNMLDKYENMMTELLEKEQTSRADWEQKDPIQLLGQLEECIMTENYSKIVDVLSDSTGMDPSVEEFLREEIIEVVDQSLDGVLYRDTDEKTTYVTGHADGVLLDAINGSNPISNENYNQSLLN